MEDSLLDREAFYCVNKDGDTSKPRFSLFSKDDYPDADAVAKETVDKKIEQANSTTPLEDNQEKMLRENPVAMTRPIDRKSVV